MKLLDELNPDSLLLRLECYEKLDLKFRPRVKKSVKGFQAQKRPVFCQEGIPV